MHKEKIAQLLKEQRLRKLVLKTNLVDFSSNDYLGLSRSPELSKLISVEYEQFQPQNGSTGSRLLTGNTNYAEDLEGYLADHFNTQSSLLFNSGYMANLALFSALLLKGDTVFYDELSHTSIKDGIRLSFAQRYSFKHNDLDDLENKIRKVKGSIYVAVESIYSMDGDRSPLEELVSLCKKYGAKIIVDEAHSTGIYGDRGSGLVCELGLESEIYCRVHTFGKAMGVHGACIAGSKDLINYLVNFSRPFIYTTAMSLHNLVTIKSAFEFLKRNMQLVTELQRKIDFFKIKSKGVNLNDSTSSIQVIVIPGIINVKKMADQLEIKGFDIRPIFSPTVKEGQERLRICLHSFNTNDQIGELIDVIQS